jgi:hypothetical protein
MTLSVIKQHSSGNIFADVYRVRRDENCTGRAYSIKGLSTFLNSGDCPNSIDIPERIREDLSFYQQHCQQKKQEWTSRKRDSRLETGE